MAIDGINGYLSTAATTAAASTSTTSKNTTTSLNMDDFLKLMVAQLQNQDMNNATDNTEFMAQMAQFSMVQALTELKELNQTTYSISLIGKEVSVATTKSDGTLKVEKGTVEGVNLYNGDAQIVMGGVTYPMSSIMEVGQAK